MTHRMFLIGKKMILILMAKTKSQKQVTANVTDGFERLWDLYVVKFFAAS